MKEYEPIKPINKMERETPLEFQRKISICREALYKLYGEDNIMEIGTKVRVQFSVRRKFQKQHL